jgi:hypothetical protein
MIAQQHFRLWQTIGACGAKRLPAAVVRTGAGPSPVLALRIVTTWFPECLTGQVRDVERLLLIDPKVLAAALSLKQRARVATRRMKNW